MQGCVCAQLCPTLCAPLDHTPPVSLSMEFSRQEYWSELPIPSPGDCPRSGIETLSPTLIGTDFFFFLDIELPGKPFK